MSTPDTILLGHGSGGKLSRSLISDFFRPYFNSPMLSDLPDAATPQLASGLRLAFTTDAYVVDPLFFPGGNIGHLALCGTINDLAVSFARPRWISAAFVLEEGLPLDTLRPIVESMSQVAALAGVEIVTGDTKVVPRGKCDKMFITTSGIGEVFSAYTTPQPAQRGDKVIVSGTLADHGMAVLTAREGFKLESPVKSDVSPLNELIFNLLTQKFAIRQMKDPTRGGIASVLVEMSEKQGLGMEINEAEIPIEQHTRDLCEWLGFDPLHVANEGKVVLIVSAHHAQAVLETLRAHPLGSSAAIIGQMTADPPGRIILNTQSGGRRLIQMLSGDQLPRIC